MTETSASYRRILKSSSIIGGASFLNIAIGLLRTKVLAVLLGPTGVGLVSLYRGLLTTTSTVATLGLDTVGARQIAEADAKEDARALAIARRAMFWAALVLGSAGTMAVWILRRRLAEWVLGGAAHADAVGGLALGVALTGVGASQGALIQGMRRIADIARITIYGAASNTVVGVALIWRRGQAGLVSYVLVTPVAVFLLGRWYVSGLPKPGTYPISFSEMTHQWGVLFRIGVAFMGATLKLIESMAGDAGDGTADAPPRRLDHTLSGLFTRDARTGAPALTIPLPESVNGERIAGAISALLTAVGNTGTAVGGKGRG